MRIHKAFLTIATIALCSQYAVAQSPFWLPTSGPVNGEITGFDVGADRLLLAAAVQGVFVSDDQGSHWSKVLDVSATAVLHQSGRYILASTGGSGIYLSGKNGALWGHVNDSPDTVWALARDECGRVFAGGNGTVSISRDKGVSWQTAPLAHSEVFGFVFRPYGRVWAATNGDGIFFSRDTGQTWHNMVNGLDDKHVQDLAFAPDGQLFAATQTGVFTSTNNGLLWTRSSPNWGVTVHKVVVTHGGTVVAATHGGVYISSDKGINWSQKNDGLTNLVTGALLSTGQDELYVGTWGGGVFRWSTQPDGLAGSWLSGECAGDGFGYAMARAGDVNGDGWQDILVGAPYADDNGPSSGAAYLFFGGPDLSNRAPLVLTAPVGPLSGFGYSVAGVGDLNRDGYDDFVVGAPGFSGIGLPTVPWEGVAGSAYVYFGRPIMGGNPDITLSGTRGFGASVTGAGDVNGDTFPDLAIAATWEPVTTDIPSLGIIHVYFGSAGKSLLPGPLLQPYTRHLVTQGKITIGLGDYDHDGYDDIATSSIYDTRYFDICMFRGGNPMDSTYDWLVSGDRMDEGAPFPRSLTSGDINGDSASDLVAGGGFVADPLRSPTRILIYLGGDGKWHLYQPSNTVSNTDTLGYGSGLACIGDINGDGFDDLVAGTPGAAPHGVQSGGGYLYVGGNPLPPEPVAELAGGTALDRAGSVVGGAGDFEGDGNTEVLFSALGTDSTNVFPGRVYLVDIGSVAPLSPGIPQLVSVPDGATQVPLVFTLFWRRSAHTQWYEYYVSADSTFSGTGWHNTQWRDTSAQFEAPPGNTQTYYWKVRAFNKGGSSAWSAVRRFTTVSGSVAEVELLQPPDCAEHGPEAVQFVWCAIPRDSITYHLLVAADSQMVSTVIDTVLRDTTFTTGMPPANHTYWWRVTAKCNVMYWGATSKVQSFTVRLTGVSSGSGEIPATVVLAPNYPNPFNPVTTIRFGLPARFYVTLSVYSVLGQQVARVVDGTFDAGYREVSYSAAGLSSGMYFYRLEVRPLGDQSAAATGGSTGVSILTRKLCVVR